MVSLRANIRSLISIILISGTLAACQKHEVADHNSAGHGDHGTPKDWKFTLVKGMLRQAASFLSSSSVISVTK